MARTRGFQHPRPRPDRLRQLRQGRGATPHDPGAPVAARPGAAVHHQPRRRAVNDTFEAIDLFVWAMFVLEYLIKLYLSPSRQGFFTHHLLDLAVIAVPMFRPLRAARLLRILNLGRVGIVLANALRRTKALFTHRGLHFVLLAVLAIIFACSALVLSFEHQAKGSNIHNFGDALWWAIVTVTTVGYGDKFPVTRRRARRRHRPHVRRDRPHRRADRHGGVVLRRAGSRRRPRRAGRAARSHGGNAGRTHRSSDRRGTVGISGCKAPLKQEGQVLIGRASAIARLLVQRFTPEVVEAEACLSG